MYAGVNMCFEEWKDNLVICTEPTREPHATHVSPVREPCSSDFKYFKKVEMKVYLLTWSFSTYIEKAVDNIQLELTELKSNKRLKEKLNSVKCGCYVILNTTIP
jgi:hypothetical protein